VTEYDLSRAVWRKSSYSGGTGGNCVEVAQSLPGAVTVRDSKDPHGLVLIFAPSQWKAFIAEAQTGGFDLA
jgi:Domain of unknown function (DUF397)